MTDARLPSRWLTDPQMDALTDRLWRIHTAALMWSAEQGTDGQIPRRTLRLLHPDGGTAADADELAAAGLWQVADTGYEVNGWARTQSLAVEVEATRAANRERQARHRARLAVTPAPAAPVVTRDVTRDITGQSRRQGEARPGGVSSAHVNGWGSAPPPSSCSRHPDGTDAPCGACGRARVAREEYDAHESQRPKPQRAHEHAWASDGTCFRPAPDGQPCLERREAVSA